MGGIPKLLTSITIKTGYIEILVEGEYCKAAYCDFISTYNNTEYLQEEITEKCKPYLRPLSSMTEEELYEVQEILGEEVEIRDGFIRIIDSSIIAFTYLELQAVFEWFNTYHFDYRGLIEKGLAIEVTEENNPYKD